MRTDHLTIDELESLARGERQEPQVLAHLEVCADCRESAREGVFATRYVRPLAGDHPDDHVLTALWSNALAPARQEEIARHVESCSRCRAVQERLMRATVPIGPATWARTTTKAWAVASTVRRRST